MLKILDILFFLFDVHWLYCYSTTCLISFSFFITKQNIFSRREKNWWFLENFWQVLLMHQKKKKNYSTRIKLTWEQHQIQIVYIHSHTCILTHTLLCMSQVRGESDRDAHNSNCPKITTVTLHPKLFNFSLLFKYNK